MGDLMTLNHRALMLQGSPLKRADVFSSDATKLRHLPRLYDKESISQFQCFKK
jgi:hypothetical protein